MQVIELRRAALANQTEERSTTTSFPVLLTIWSVLYLSNAYISCFKKGYVALPAPANALAAGIFLMLLTIAFAGNLKERYNINCTVGFFKLIAPLFGIGVMYALYYFIGYYFETDNTGQDVFLMLFNLFCSSVILQYLISFNVSMTAIIRILEITLILLIVTVYIDVVYPSTFSDLDTRAAGFPANPNITSFRLVILLTLLLVSNIPVYRKVVYFFFGSIAVFLTFSRGGVLLLSILLIYLIFMNMKTLKWSNFLKFVPVSMIVVTLLVIASSLDLRAINNIVDTDYTAKRLNMFSSVNTVIDKNDSRVDLVSFYFDQATYKPFTGFGALQAKNEKIDVEGPHNMYVLLFFELGIGGIVLFFWFLYRLFAMARKLNSFFLYIWFIGLLVYSVFSHNLITDYFFVFSTPLIYFYAYTNHKSLNVLNA